MIACKKMRKYCLFPIVLILTLIPCVLPAQGISPETNSLSSQLDTLIKYQLPAGSNVSVSAYDLTANKVLYDYQADKLSRPASTMKLLTTITALARPEADESFRTEVWYKGVIERGAAAFLCGSRQDIWRCFHERLPVLGKRLAVGRYAPFFSAVPVAADAR